MRKSHGVSGADSAPGTYTSLPRPPLNWSLPPRPTSRSADRESPINVVELPFPRMSHPAEDPPRPTACHRRSPLARPGRSCRRASREPPRWLPLPCHPQHRSSPDRKNGALAGGHPSMQHFVIAAEVEDRVPGAEEATALQHVDVVAQARRNDWSLPAADRSRRLVVLRAVRGIRTCVPNQRSAELTPPRPTAVPSSNTDALDLDSPGRRTSSTASAALAVDAAADEVIARRGCAAPRRRVRCPSRRTSSLAARSRREFPTCERRRQPPSTYTSLPRPRTSVVAADALRARHCPRRPFRTSSNSVPIRCWSLMAPPLSSSRAS